MDSGIAVILGFIQGLTEFLPVSSSGHLVLFQKYLGIKQHDLVFDIVVHVGTLVPILFVFRKLLWRILKSISDIRSQEFRFILLIAVGTLPAVVIGLTFKDLFEQLFNHYSNVAFSFIFTGLVLYFTKKIQTSGNHNTFSDFESAIEDFKDFSFAKALLIGFAQAIAIAPGVSRSGMTIASGLYLGLTPRAASVFSFALAVPVILGAAVLSLNDLIFIENLTGYGVGFVSALVSGCLGLWGVLRTVKNRKLEYFSGYLWILGIGLLLL